MKLMLDVDGVVLTHKPGGVGPFGTSLKEGAGEFFKWATSNFDCYWLTGWAPNGNRQLLDTMLLPHLPEEAKLVKVALWNTLKTEAITDGESLWCDDQLMPAERAYLEENEWINNFILVNPNDPSLLKTMSDIKSRLVELR